MDKMSFDKTTSASEGLSRGVTRAMTRTGSVGELPDTPFDVHDFEFFKMWKQRPAVRKLVEEEAAMLARQKKLEEQRREEARLEACGWHRLHMDLRSKGLPDLGSKSDLARRLFSALQAEARGEDPAALFRARDDPPSSRPVSRAESAPALGSHASHGSYSPSHGSPKRPQSQASLRRAPA